MNKYYLSGLLLIGAAMVSCSDNDEPEGPQPNIQTITFEECEFAKDKTNNLVSGAETTYTELGASFVNKEYYTMVAGAIVSDAAKIQDSGTAPVTSVALDKTVEHAGADDTDKFCVLAQTAYSGLVDIKPRFSFKAGVEHKIVSIKVMNTTQMYEFLKYGFYSYKPLQQGDICELIITGYNKGHNETGSVKVTLGENKTGEPDVMSEWTEVDLSSLGEVNSVDFKVVWSESWSKPSPGDFSVAVDEIKFEFPAE